jgi:hypothetical protein
LSSLTYEILELPFHKDTVESVRNAYGTDLGKARIYPVYISFKTSDGWSKLHRMIYDTGAVISLLPSSYLSLLGVKKYATAKLGGITPETEVRVRLARVVFRFVDLNRNTSPEIQAWFAIAERDDVPRIIGLKDISLTHKLVVDGKRGLFDLEF